MLSAHGHGDHKRNGGWPCASHVSPFVLFLSSLRCSGVTAQVQLTRHWNSTVYLISLIGLTNPNLLYRAFRDTARYSALSGITHQVPCPSRNSRANDPSRSESP